MIQHEDSCKVTCTDNDKTVDAEVMHFRHEDGVTVVIAGNKIVMKYNKRHDVYIGSMMGMEFTTKGPKYWHIKNGR